MSRGTTTRPAHVMVFLTALSGLLLFPSAMSCCSASTMLSASITPSPNEHEACVHVYVCVCAQACEHPLFGGSSWFRAAGCKDSQTKGAKTACKDSVSDVHLFAGTGSSSSERCFVRRHGRDAPAAPRPSFWQNAPPVAESRDPAARTSLPATFPRQREGTGKGQCGATLRVVRGRVMLGAPWR